MAVPAHTRTSQAGFELFNGTFDSTRANGPAVLSKFEILRPTLVGMEIMAVVGQPSSVEGFDNGLEVAEE